jgi:hypothetical protein
MIRKTISVIALSLGLTSTAQSNSLEEISSRVTGEFDNNLQSLLTKNDEEPHQRLHFIHTKFPSVTKEGINIYVEQSVAASDYIYRQRVYNITFKGGIPALEIYSIKDPKRFTGAHLNPTLLNTLKLEDLEHRAGCDVFFSPENDEGEIIGRTDKSSCSIVSRGKKLNIETRLILGKDFLDIYDEAHDEEGNPVWYRKDQTGGRMLRARIFDCWSVLKKGETREEGWEVSKNNRIHDQGGKFTIEFEDKGFDITLSQLVYGSEGKKIMKLGFHKKDVSPTFSYTWANPEASNIGLNLGHLQAGCTLVK